MSREGRDDKADQFTFIDDMVLSLSSPALGLILSFSNHHVPSNHHSIRSQSLPFHFNHATPYNAMEYTDTKDPVDHERQNHALFFIPNRNSVRC